MKDYVTMDEVLVHIGYHKTGTSYFQSKFFTAKFGFSLWPRAQREKHPMLIDLGTFEQVSEQSLDCLQDVCESASTAGLSGVISQERLSGHTSSGGFDSAMIAKRNRRLFPNAKILIVIRERESLIRSAYSQFVAEGGSLSLSRFLRDAQKPVRNAPLFLLCHLEFAPLIEHDQDLFSNESVPVLPYQSFVADTVHSSNQIGLSISGPGWNELCRDDYDSTRVIVERQTLTQAFRRFLNATVSRIQFRSSGYLSIPKLIRAYEKTIARTDRFIPVSVDQFFVNRQKRTIRKFVGDYFRPFNRCISGPIGCDFGTLE